MAVSPPPAAPVGPAPAPAAPQSPDASQTFLERFWPHITAAAGSLIAIGLGCLSSKGIVGPWGTAEDITLVVGGLGGLGITATAANNR